MKDFLFLSLSIGADNNQKAIKMIDSVMEKTEACFVLTTDDMAFFQNHYNFNERLVLDEYKGKTWVYNDRFFDYNLKRLPFRVAKDRSEKYLIWMDSDSYLNETFESQLLLKDFETIVYNGFDFLARRVTLTMDGAIYCTEPSAIYDQIRAKHNFFKNHLDYDEYQVVVPIENLMFFVNNPKMQVFYETWEKLGDLLSGDLNPHILPWVEAVEIGIAAHKAGIKAINLGGEYNLCTMISFEHHGVIFKTIFG